MRIQTVAEALVPWYGSGARFRFYLRLREFYRRHHFTFLGQCLKSFLQYRYGCEISINASISPAVSFMHTVGVVIGDDVIIEPGVIIYSGVCLGRKDVTKNEYPIVKKGALLCTGCSVLGKVTIEENAIIGAHALVLTDCVRGGVYVGSPAKLIK